MNEIFNDPLGRSFLEMTFIEDSLPFGHMPEKTQVTFPQNGLAEVPKNRATHSYEVVSSAKLMVLVIANQLGLRYEDIDYMYSVSPASLGHDIGHPPFGHDGSYFLNKYFKEKGLPEGFTDNNNNLVVIDKNKIALSDYTIASTIKYPEKLYSWQEGKYLPMLQSAIDQDEKHYGKIGIFLKGMKTTIACQIMDEADRNSYVCSDLADFLSMGNTLNFKKLWLMSNEFKLSDKYTDEMKSLISIAKSGNKREIKSFFSSLKLKFNSNYKLTENGIVEVDSELMRYREFLNDVSHEFYIKPIRNMQLHTDNMAKLLSFTDHVFNNGFYPSTHYREKIETANSEEDRLRYMRDMISEVSDWYVIRTCENLNLDFDLRNDEQVYGSRIY